MKKDIKINDILTEEEAREAVIKSLQDSKDRDKKIETISGIIVFFCIMMVFILMAMAIWSDDFILSCKMMMTSLLFVALAYMTLWMVRR